MLPIFFWLNIIEIDNNEEASWLRRLILPYNRFTQPFWMRMRRFCRTCLFFGLSFIALHVIEFSINSLVRPLRQYMKSINLLLVKALVYYIIGSIFLMTTNIVRYHLVEKYIGFGETHTLDRRDCFSDMVSNAAYRYSLRRVLRN